ncbi:hypothetical protein EW146_g7773 [Bondarzewia mesenterica]|uniref:Tropomyosin n=1 Tax=Bondarzewia mesenterica TaxID=1095465 RepID=A0A4S4LKA2_9AGAM|nr:hypothetical protein EW146_g7773 [Bondarzewia mesenterica]
MVNQKLTHLRTEADDAVARAEEAEAKNKKFDQLLLEKDQEVASLQHRLSVLEEELDSAEKNGKETVEKSRSLDVKVEHLERQLLRVEQERDEWERKYEVIRRSIYPLLGSSCSIEAQEKYRASKAELDELVKSMESI